MGAINIGHDNPIAELVKYLTGCPMQSSLTTKAARHATLARTPGLLAQSVDSVKQSLTLRLVSS